MDQESRGVPSRGVDRGRQGRVSAPYEWAAVVLCHDQERWIGAQLAALYPRVAEIVVVDGAATSAAPEWDRELTPSTDASLERARSAPDPEGKVRVLEPRGSQAAALEAALAGLASRHVLVLAADEFVAELGEVLRAVERVPLCEAFTLPVVELLEGGSRCQRRTGSVLFALRRHPGRRFTGARSLAIDETLACEHVDDLLLRYGRVDEPSPQGRLQCYLNRHPAAVAPLLGRCALGPRREPAAGGAVGPGARSTDPDVSIIVPFHGGLEVTLACVEAVQRTAGTRRSWELLLWDDASPEDSSVPRELARDPHVRLGRNDENLGFLRTVNRALREARGRYVVLLNNDTEPLPGWLDALVDTAERDRSVGAVGAMLLYPDGSLQEAGGIVFSDGSGWNYGKGDRPERSPFNYLREVDYCSGACLLVRTELFRALGGFDERFAPAYYEDTDLCFQLRAGGHRVVYQPRARVVHLEGHTSGRDTGSGVKRHQVANREKFVEKWRAALAEQPAPGSNPHVARERTPGKHFLVANPSFPRFDRDSGSFRLFQILSILRRQGHRVTFFSRDSGGQVRHRRALEELGICTYVGRHEHEARVGRTRTVHARVKELLHETPVDVAILYHFRTARRLTPLIRQHSPLTRVVTDSVDLHYLRQEREARVLGDRERLREARRTRRKEVAAYRKSDLVVAITEDEAAVLRRTVPEVPVIVIPNVHPVATRPPCFEDRCGLLFVGYFGHPPNADAIGHLVEEVMPLVWDEMPDVRLSVVGGGLDGRIERLACERVAFLGFVDELSPILDGARVLVAPLRFGAGAKGKIGQALSAGLPVVTTDVGTEGLGLVEGEHVLTAPGPEEFAKQVVRLYSDRSLWSSLSRRGQEHVERRFSPGAVERAITQHVVGLEPFAPSLRRRWIQVRNIVH